MKHPALLLLPILSALSIACSRAAEHDHSDGEHADHGADEHAAPKSDAHHVAENRRDCHDDVVLPPGALERYGIQVAPVRAITLTPTVSAPGHLAFPEGAVARIGSAVEGRIVDVRVQSGASVSAGEALLVVESPELGEAQSQYLEARAIAASSGPSIELARNAFERAKELHASVQGIALSEVERREAELLALERARDLARAAEAAAFHRLLIMGMTESSIRELEASGQIRPRITIVAPIAGRVVDVAVKLGELVGPEKDRLLVIGDAMKLWAIAEVSESRLAEVALGAPARVRLPALEETSYAGGVAAVPVTLEASTRTAEVRVEVENPDGKLLPGMFIQVEIDSSRGAGAPVLAVPDGAVLTVEGRASVFMPVEPGGSVFCKHDIEIGPAVGEEIPVLSGLSAGDLVVVAGAFRLKAEHGKASASHEH